MKLPFAIKDTLTQGRTDVCACVGCQEQGLYRAPRQIGNDRSFYWFCLTHVRAYNAAWDYFSGLSAAQIEARIRFATVWERRTWPMGQSDSVLKKQRAASQSTAGAGKTAPLSPAVQKALAVLDLTPPLSFAMIKNQYRILVKKYHPDVNQGSSEAEERFKAITEAYETLCQKTKKAA